MSAFVNLPVYLKECFYSMFCCVFCFYLGFRRLYNRAAKIYDIMEVAWLQVPIFIIFTCLLSTTMFWSSLHFKLLYHRYVKVVVRLRGTVLTGQEPQWYCYSNVVAYHPMAAVWTKWYERILAWLLLCIQCQPCVTVLWKLPSVVIVFDPTTALWRQWCKRLLAGSC